MNDLVSKDLYNEISQMLIAGEGFRDIQNVTGCSPSDVFLVMESDRFARKALTSFTNLSKSIAVIALRNVINVANDDNVGTSVRLKANQFLVEKAHLIQEMSLADASEPSQMSQDALVKTLDELQKERNKRMGIVEAVAETTYIEVIEEDEYDMVQEPSVEDMF